MSERQSLFMKIMVLLLLQNGLLAVIASTLSPGMSPAMTATLAAGVILFSMATAMMATRIAGSHALGQPPTRRSFGSTAENGATSGLGLSTRSHTPKSSPECVSPAGPRLIGLKGADLDNAKGSADRQKASEEALSALDAGLRRLATGDLSVSLDTPFSDGFEGLRGDFNKAASSLNESLTTIITSAGTLHGECAEARIRLAQERSLIPDEVPALSVAGNGLRDIADLLREQDAALREIAAIAANAKAYWQQSCETATKEAKASESLRGSEKQVGEIAALMRDVAFRTNMLSVSASVAAANMAGPQETLPVFAAELRDMAETSAAAAKQASLLERDVALSLKHTRSQADHLLRQEQHLHESFETIGNKLAAISQASTMSSDMVARSGVILDGTLKFSGQRRALDHALEAALERMSQELAIINRHCGRFIHITVLHDDHTPPDTRPPHHRSHLRLVKS
ncbi:methyl-accepting chemotaxis protein [Rhizobium wenxiniae]|uniref:methyl-accepting chemotaxis protein n=1 Tax=Rhizobium wenxiniae TaxID=1737357 RepID=UPI001C6F580E|nr:methyl-accepting chemotaxis protein [Rhizobium wenxiniae]MBW9086226.1 methyl-accepting chemotaxis protein [Rhizobium wenxiniae]